MTPEKRRLNHMANCKWAKISQNKQIAVYLAISFSSLSGFSLPVLFLALFVHGSAMRETCALVYLSGALLRDIVHTCIILFKL